MLIIYQPKNAKSKYTCTILFLICALALKGQSPTPSKISDAAVVYNTSLAKVIGGGQIPFDKRFTLIVPGFNTKNIQNVFAYYAKFKNGQRQLVRFENRILHDMDLDFNVSNDSLFIFFPPLRPNKSFEVAVTRAPSETNLENVYKLNEALSKPDIASAKDFFLKVRNGSTEIIGREALTFFTYANLSSYIIFYNSKLSPIYDKLKSNASYAFAQFPDLSEMHEIQLQFKSNKISFKDLNYLSRLVSDNKVEGIFLGTETVKSPAASPEVKNSDYNKRVQNINASMLYFDSLANALQTNIITLEPNNSNAKTFYATIKNILENLSRNLYFINDSFNNIKAAINSNTDIAETELLLGETVFKDIASAGGNVITFDLGVANIGVADFNNKFVFMPKPYYGINIYFRPIDKNTRLQVIPKKYARNNLEGPLYNLASERGLIQRLSLNIGLTFTSMSNSHFDYLINTSALLTGIGCRLGRFMKVSGGLSLLKGVSSNPLISEKKVVAGAYLAFSADIDLVQGIKDFTSMIFK